MNQPLPPYQTTNLLHNQMNPIKHCYFSSSTLILIQDNLHQHFLYHSWCSGKTHPTHQTQQVNSPFYFNHNASLQLDKCMQSCDLSFKIFHKPRNASTLRQTTTAGHRIPINNHVYQTKNYNGFAAACTTNHTHMHAALYYGIPIMNIVR